MLFDEEVEAWHTLEDYILKKNLIAWSQYGVNKVSARRMIRELMRLAAEHLASDIGPEVAKKLAFSVPTLSRSTMPKKAKAVAKARGRKPAEKPEPKPTHRIAWNRPWKRRPGDV
jgi:hypothetical protein